MSAQLKVRTPEQKVRKMLKEEETIMGLELAIKKEQYRKSQKRKPEFREMPTEKKDTKTAPVSTQKTNVKSKSIRNFFHDKIGF